MTIKDIKYAIYNILPWQVNSSPLHFADGRQTLDEEPLPSYPGSQKKIHVSFVLYPEHFIRPFTGGVSFSLQGRAVRGKKETLTTCPH